MGGSRENHLDNIFYAMGEFKLFTVSQILIAAVYCFPSAYQLLSNVFTCKQVSHRCAAAPNDSSLLLSGLDGYDLNDLSISYQQCQIVVSFNDTVLKTEECIHGMAYDEPRDASAFDLVCDHSSLARLSQTLVIAGQGVGAIFFTILSDRYGRKPILVFCNFSVGVCGVIAAFAPNYLVFAISKFAIGTFQQGCATTFSTLFMEILSTKDRRIQASHSGFLWGMSCMSFALLAFALRHQSWRILQMTLSLSSLLFIIQLLYGRESLRWLIANGKTNAILSYIRSATKMNKTSYDDTIKAYEEACHLVPKELNGTSTHNENTVGKISATKRLNLLDIMKMKRMLLNAAIMWLAWFITALSFFAIYLMSTSLAGNPYLNFFLTALMEVPSNLLLYFVLNRLGRKVTLIAAFFIVGVGTAVCGVFRSLDQNTVNSTCALVFSCISMAGASAAFNLVYFYTTEIFPTNFRNQAVGVSSFMGRVGGMIAPFTGILSEKAKWAPGALIGTCAFLVCFLIVLLPETKGRELPQTIDDVKAWLYNNNHKNSKNEDKEINYAI